jgi:autotransporter translocation and assembly factor TamB
MQLARRLTHALILVLTLMIGATAAAVIVSQTAWFKNWMRAYIVREANLYLNGTLSIERLGGNVLYGLEMENIDVTMDGQKVVAVKDIGLDYNLWDFVTKGLSVDNIRLDKPVIYLRRQGDTWTLSRLIKKQETEANRRGPERPITIQDIGISDGSLVIDEPVGTSGVDVPNRIDHLDAKLNFKYEPVHYSIDITHVSFRGSEPAIALNALSGGIAVRDDAVYVENLAIRTAETSVTVDGAVQQYLSTPVYNLHISSDKLDIPEFAQLLPALAGIRLQPQVDAKIAGPADRLGIELNVVSSAGQLHSKVVANVQGPTQSVNGDVSVRHLDLAGLLNDQQQRSDITADARVDLRGSSLTDVQSLQGTVAVNAPHIAAAGYAADRIHGTARLEGRQVAVDARGAAYGATASVKGRVVLPQAKEAVAYNLSGRAQHVNLRRLPQAADAPRAATDVNAAYHIVGTSAKPAKLDLQFDSSTVADARIEKGGTATLALDEKPIAYKADVTVSGLDVQRVGEQFAIPALANDRFKSSISGHITASGHAASGDQLDVVASGTLNDSAILGGRVGNVAFDAAVARDVAHVKATGDFADFDPAILSGRSELQGRIKGALNVDATLTHVSEGVRPDNVDVVASGTLNDSAILGGRVGKLAFDASVARDVAHVKAAGDFADVDPAVLSGRKELQGRIKGALNIDATLAHVSESVSPESVEATGTVTLEPSTVGGLHVTAANVDATYHNSTADIRSLEITGPDLNVKAEGLLALNDNGSSKLTVHADTSNLETIGKLVNQPLAGIANVDATVTGNRRQLEAKGHLIGNGVKYEDAGALTVATDFTAQMPELTVTDATIKGDAHATFVTIGGQNVNQIDGTLGYRQRQLEFDLTAKQPERSLGTTGSLLLHPDHQEVHLQKLGLQTAGQTWQLAAGTAATINYADDVVTVTDLKLVNGDQSITADGSFGRPTDALKVTVANVDVANIDALLLREPQLTGRLNGNASVHAASEPQSNGDAAVASSLKKIPQVDADFQITQGGFRQFRYETFGGTIQYRGKGMTVDAKLQQSPTTYITAKGYVPTALFTAVSDAEREAAHGASAVPEDRVDLHIESTPIDLGLIQGFTSELTNVTGTFQAKLDVIGSAADPHPVGLLTLQKGAFTVTSTGVPYNTVEGKVELQPDRVKIGAITALDNHFNAVTISGDLAVHERSVGDVQVYIHTDDFKVIDNEMGNIRVNSDLRIAGDLRAPRIEGDLGVTTGTVNLDPILAAVGESAYSTAPAVYGEAPAALDMKAPESPPATQALSALTMNVHVTVPDDLVVKAADLQAPGSPVGMGALTVTLGGDVRATKALNGDLTLVGLVNTVRGAYTFQGRRFEIMRDGFVRFTGEPLSELDPTLDIATRRTIRAVEARVNLRGTLKNPEVVLSSTPPLEQADILALILFNQPANELGEGQQISLVQQAQNLAGGALTRGLSQSIASALNLTEFDINLAPESGQGPEVRIGQQLGKNVYLNVEQGIGDQSQTNVVLEYELQRWLRLQTNFIQGTQQHQLFQRVKGSGVDLLFFFSY